MTTTTPFVPRPPSLRSRFTFHATRLTLRPLAEALPDNALGIAAARQVLAVSMALGARPARGVATRPVDVRGPDERRVVGEWAEPRSPREDGVVLYVHGSGYSLCSTRTHRPLVTQLAAATRRCVFSTEYRLAPRHVFPAAADDVRRAWDWLLSQGWTADQVVVAGDSAGGHLALDLALQLLREGEPQPAGLLLLSPLADVTLELARVREQQRRDPMASAAGARRLVAHYLGTTEATHPRLTHVVAPHEMLPPTLVQAGGAEMLAADAEHVHAMLAASGTDVRLELWPGQVHVFQAASRAVPEASAALRRAAAFVVEALDRARGEAVAESVRGVSA